MALYKYVYDYDYEHTYPLPDMAIPADNARVYPRVWLNDGTAQDGGTLYTDTVFNHHIGTDCHVWSNPTTFANLCRRILKCQTIIGDIQPKRALW